MQSLASFKAAHNISGNLDFRRSKNGERLYTEFVDKAGTTRSLVSTKGFDPKGTANVVTVTEDESGEAYEQPIYILTNKDGAAPIEVSL